MTPATATVAASDNDFGPSDATALAAFADYTAAYEKAQAAMADPLVPISTRMRLHERAIDAHGRFADAYQMLVEPTPPDLRQEAARIGAEGTALFVALAGFIGLFLPGLEADFWPLAATLIAAAALGGWAVHYLGRLGQHIGRRM